MDIAVFPNFIKIEMFARIKGHDESQLENSGKRVADSLQQSRRVDGFRYSSLARVGGRDG